MPPAEAMKSTKSKRKLSGTRASKPRGVKARAKRLLHWWQARGTETCSACSHSYHYEMEYRCVDCDRGVCAVCAVHQREAVYCPECA